MQENINSNDEVEKEVKEVGEDLPPLTRNELIDQLSYILESIERLPQHALYAPITNADFAALIMILKAIFKTL